jgi:hypothetical protein
MRPLARRYVFDPTLRDRLVNLAETTEPEVQRRFLMAINDTLRDLSRDVGTPAN